MELTEAQKQQVEEVREEIAERLALDFFIRCLSLPEGVTVLDEARTEANKILSKLAILDKDQSLPKTITNKKMAEAYGGYDFVTADMKTVCIKEQRNMLNSSFRRIIPLEGTDANG